MKTVLRVVIILLLSQGCTQKTPTEEKIVLPPKPAIVTETKKDTAALAPAPVITYHLLTDKDSIASISAHYQGFSLQILLALNRFDSVRIHRAKKLILPDTFINNLLYYSPFPQKIQLLDTVNKALMVSYPLQAVAAYEQGHLVRWAPTSLGKKSTPTPTGLFFTNWKSKETKSTDDSTWILKWYFNLENMRGVSMHQYELPGVPASHACIRLLQEDAKWMYYWAEQWRLNKEGTKIDTNGTPVIIFGTYDFAKPAPWQKINEGGFVPSHTEDSLAPIISPLIPRMLKHPADTTQHADTAMVE